MKQYINYNLIYYITRYNHSNPIYKAILFLIIYLLSRQFLDLSNVALCMDETITESTLPRPRRIKTYISSESDMRHYLNAELLLKESSLQEQKDSISLLTKTIEDQYDYLLDLSHENNLMKCYVESYRQQNTDLAYELNKTKLRLARAHARLQSYMPEDTVTITKQKTTRVSTPLLKQLLRKK